MAALKVLLMVFVPSGGDFINWSAGAGLALHYILTGHVPPVSRAGAYGIMFIFLSPFYWLWSVLEPHQPALLSSDHLTASAATSLSIVMKTPIFLSDLGIAILISKLVQHASPFAKKRGLAVLSWYANPFVIYYSYVFGAMEVIPTAIYLLGVYYGAREKWFDCTFFIFIAGLLRVFAFVTIPFLFFTLRSSKTRFRMILGASIPLVIFLATVYASRSGTIGEIASVPLRENWLDYFIGPNISMGPFLELTPFLLTLQLYAVGRHWERGVDPTYVAAVSLLALLSGGGSAIPASLVGTGYHVLWVVPLLSVILGLTSGELPLFLLFIFTAYLTPPAYPFASTIASSRSFEPFITAIFYAAKAAYIIRLNLANLRPTIRDAWLRLVRESPLHQLSTR